MVPDIFFPFPFETFFCENYSHGTSLASSVARFMLIGQNFCGILYPCKAEFLKYLLFQNPDQTLRIKKLQKIVIKMVQEFGVSEDEAQLREMLMDKVKF